MAYENLYSSKDSRRKQHKTHVTEHQNTIHSKDKNNKNQTLSNGT